MGTLVLGQPIPRQGSAEEEEAAFSLIGVDVEDAEFDLQRGDALTGGGGVEPLLPGSGGDAIFVGYPWAASVFPGLF